MQSQRPHKTPHSIGKLVATTKARLRWAVFFFLASPVFVYGEPPTRLIQCGRFEAETTINLSYQIPGSSPAGNLLYARAFRQGDAEHPPIDASQSRDQMGTTTWMTTEFTDKEVIFTIRQVPGPDRVKPYQVAIRAPFRKNVSGTLDGTVFGVTWSDGATNGGPPAPGLNFQAGPMSDSIMFSSTEVLMFPHDRSLAYDIERDPGSGSGAWVRFESLNPNGEISQTFRIQLLSDPGGDLGKSAVAVSEVEALCAPFLPNSLEGKCDVQEMDRETGHIFFCLLTNAALTDVRTPTSARNEHLFIGVFRVSDCVAFVVGHVADPDGADYHMMLETLNRCYTIPVIGAPAPTPSPTPTAPMPKNIL
jgi:hypothetical protein